ncbi:MAG: hypothetical protein RR336_04125, partial [Oscillospiraceae bacterium]
MKKRCLALFLSVLLLLGVLPSTASAYVGGMTLFPSADAHMEAAQIGQYYSITNDYMSFYLDAAGNSMTVPAQMTLEKAQEKGITERHIFNYQLAGQGEQTFTVKNVTYTIN